jgi:hypothetical protein
MEEPKMPLSNTEREDPNRALLQMEKDAPMRENSRRAIEEPQLTIS